MTRRPGPPTLAALFTGFLGIGIVGFGGVLPWLRRMMVEQRRWFLPEEFNDLLALCQFLPGPNVVNMAVATGTRFRGITGALACVAGLLTAPFLIVVSLGSLYDRFGRLPVVASAFDGLAAGAAGLVAATAVKIAAPLEGHLVGIAIAAVTFVAVVALKLPLLPTMFVMAPISVGLCAEWPKRLAKSSR